MEVGLNLFLRTSLQLPVRVRTLNGIPKIIAGGIPVIPINLVLQQREREMGATRVSLERYACAARLYVEFCAHRGKSLIGISNEEFRWFANALIGDPFPNDAGKYIYLSGKRGKRTADLMLTLLYSLAQDIAERYDTSFDWVRYKGISDFQLKELQRIPHSGRSQPLGLQRVHHFKYTAPKVVGLPDDQFARLLVALYERWMTVITDGDLANAESPELQKGALFWRNLAILMALRCIGSRRGEVVQIRLCDIDRANSVIYLVTKRHKERLPVLMYPWVRDIIWIYTTQFRPVVVTSSLEDQQALFVSHSVSNYGEKLSDQSIRAVIDALRPELQAPWNKKLTPHMLRHSFGYDLQKLAGPAAVVTGMRHASSRSGEPYAAGFDVFADQLLEPGNRKLEQIFAQAGLLDLLKSVSTKECNHG